MFQSLVGFKINWNVACGLWRASESEFQSLVGFKINWNPNPGALPVHKMLFQSLVGFKINWNLGFLLIELGTVRFNP